MLTDLQQRFFKAIQELNQLGQNPKYRTILDYAKIGDSSNNYVVLRKLEREGYIQKIGRCYYAKDVQVTEKQISDDIDRYKDNPIIVAIIGVAHNADSPDILKYAKEYFSKYYDDELRVVLDMIHLFLTDHNNVPNRSVQHTDDLDQRVEEAINRLFPNNQNTN